MTRAGSTAQRGYTGQHTRLRQQWKPRVDAGQAHCTEIVCLYDTRWIPPRMAWDLSHDRVNGGYRGPAHRKCNRAEGARFGNHLRGLARARPRPMRARDLQHVRHW